MSCGGRRDRTVQLAKRVKRTPRLKRSTPRRATAVAEPAAPAASHNGNGEAAHPLGQEDVRQLLERVAGGGVSVPAAMESLRRLPFESLGFATLDHHRALRHGLTEVIFCEPKTAPQVAEVFRRLAARHDRVLGTRASPEQFKAVRRVVPGVKFDPSARVVWLDRDPGRPRLPGIVLVTAGTADLPVADEAARTLDLMGHAPRRLNDVGVAGLHRLLPHVGELQNANVVVVVAGMEGALPSVVGGLVGVPVVAVPTSVGYGTSFGGLTAMLGMLNSCASGVGVVNIDNGYGAAHLAAMINTLAWRDKTPPAARATE